MRRSYQGYGYYGMGQAPGVTVTGLPGGTPPELPGSGTSYLPPSGGTSYLPTGGSSYLPPGGTTTTLAGGVTLPTGVSLPGPETWGNDPTALALQQMGGGVVRAPYQDEEEFISYAIEAMMQTGQIHPSNVNAAENACWTCAYVYAYNAVNQLLASGASFTGTGGQLQGGSILMANVSASDEGLAAMFDPGNTTSPNTLTHNMYNRLRIATYAMAYYWNCQLESIKGLNCDGTQAMKLMAVTGNMMTMLPLPYASTPAGKAAAAAAAAPSKTGLLLGGLAIAGVAAYLVLA